MAVTFEIGIRDLLTEFLADALILFRPLESAGAVTAGTLQAVLNSLNQFFIFIESDSHSETPFSFYYI